MTVTPNTQPFICTLEFAKDAKVKLTSGYYTVGKLFDFMTERGDDYYSTDYRQRYVRGGFKWDRNLNKNAIYVQLPVGEGVSLSDYASNDGGYGYDLGFVQDNFVLELQTSNYMEYQSFMALVKTNTGESVATLTIGYTGCTESYKVLVRYCNASTTAGSMVVKINVTLTVVSEEYTS